MCASHATVPTTLRMIRTTHLRAWIGMLERPGHGGEAAPLTASSLLFRVDTRMKPGNDVAGVFFEAGERVGGTCSDACFFMLQQVQVY